MGYLNVTQSKEEIKKKYKFMRPSRFETDWDRKLQLVMVEATGTRYISNLRKRHDHTGKFIPLVSEG